jgi:hypothetical protein|nr:MAG TPA: hypothetical protein [Caudoviricetes sp.]
MFMREIVERKGVKMVCTSEEQLKLFLAAGYEMPRPVEPVDENLDEITSDEESDDVLSDVEVAPAQQTDKPKRSKKSN